ncbi:MAG TPA: GNAT family protein [Candidatus Paceibacterota bacterium]|nr:GNAT family protein [Candidatus Paceibacterota bacterium]
MYKQGVFETFRHLKSLKFEQFVISAPYGTLPPVALLPFTADCALDDSKIALLSHWRSEHSHAFPKIFEVTNERTRLWAKRMLLDRDDRMLFFIKHKEKLVGHVGLSTFDFAKSSCEIDNIIRGEADAPSGIMLSAIRVLMDWSYNELRVGEIRLRVMHDNVRALALYHRLGFVPDALYPLHKIVDQEAGEIEWISSGPSQKIDRFYVAMTHVRQSCG